MIRIRIYRSKAGSIDGFEVSGHAKYARYGKDIVCSAVSTLTQTAVIGLVKVAGVAAEYDIDDDGYIMCRITERPTELAAIKGSAILDTMLEGLNNIRESYKNYIEIVEEEV